MITRIWHGITDVKHSEDYLQYIEKTGIKSYLNTPGNLNAQILRRIEGNRCHFWTVTQWEDVDSIKKFAGEEYEKAQYYPEDKKYLLEFEPFVIHCETFVFNKPC